MQGTTEGQNKEAATPASWTALKVLGIAVLVFIAWLAVVLAISIPTVGLCRLRSRLHHSHGPGWCVVPPGWVCDFFLGNKKSQLPV